MFKTQNVAQLFFVCLFLSSLFVSLLASEILSSLYPYGKHQGDEEFGVDDSFEYYGGIMCLEIKVQPYGLRFFGARHYKLHVGV